MLYYPWFHKFLFHHLQHNYLLYIYSQHKVILCNLNESVDLRMNSSIP